MSYGFLHFQEASTFDDSKPSGALEQAMELLATLTKTPLKVPSIDDWPRISDCIRRGTLLSLTVESPTLRASLRFDPNKPNSGDYEIHIPIRRHNENGRVISVNCDRRRKPIHIPVCHARTVPDALHCYHERRRSAAHSTNLAHWPFFRAGS